MKRVVMIAAIAACMLPTVASAQLVTQLSVGNANCPFGGVSISVVTALPNTVQTSYVCSGAPGIVGRDGSGDVVPGTTELYGQVVYWDDVSEAYWVLDQNTGEVFVGPPANAYYDNNACTGTPMEIGSALATNRALLVQAAGSTTGWIVPRPISANPVDCWSETGTSCVYTGCPPYPLIEYEAASPPAISFGPIVLSR